MGKRATNSGFAGVPVGIGRRHFLRLTGVGALGLASTGLLVACGTGGNAGSAGNAGSTTPTTTGIDAVTLDQPLEIAFWHIQATLYGEAIKEIVGKFNAENRYKITVKEVFQGDYGALNQKLRAALQGGGPRRSAWPTRAIRWNI